MSNLVGVSLMDKYRLQNHDAWTVGLLLTLKSLALD